MKNKRVLTLSIIVTNATHNVTIIIRFRNERGFSFPFRLRSIFKPRVSCSPRPSQRFTLRLESIRLSTRMNKLTSPLWSDTVVMEDSPVRVTVNLLDRTTANRDMGDTTKTQRAALLLIVRVEMAPTTDSPSQVTYH